MIQLIFEHPIWATIWLFMIVGFLVFVVLVVDSNLTNYARIKAAKIVKKVSDSQKGKAT